MSLFFQMLRIRMIEEAIAKKYSEQKMRCPVHLSVGREAPAVGICAALSKDDKMVSTHRGHAHYLAKGGSLKGLIGELYGKSIGCARGNGGSMHLIDLSCNFFGSTSIVGGTIPVGVGLAFADRLRGSNATTVICIGDAAVEEGVFHEAANFASLHRLNVIFALENDEHSCYTHLSKRQPRDNFEKLAEFHNLAYAYAARDVHDIYAFVNGLKGTPSLIEIPTWRYLEHCGPNNDDHLGYRDVRLHQSIQSRPEWIEAINKEIKEAFEEVENSPFPDESEIGKYIYANS